MDQRNCIKFCVKNEINCARTFEMLTVVFGESTVSRSQVQLWYYRFKEGREDVNDACPSRPNTSITDENIEAGTKIILSNRRIIIRVVADDVGILFGSCQAIFTDILSNKNNVAWTSLRRCRRYSTAIQIWRIHRTRPPLTFSSSQN